jgi:hypothetical protein
MGPGKSPQEEGGQAGDQGADCGNIDSPKTITSQANEGSPDALRY